jgi:PKD repeat protein
MKQVLFFLLMVYSCLVFSQEKPLGSSVTKELKEQLDQNKDNELIRINIRMVSQFDIQSIDNVLTSLSREERKAYVAGELKDFTARTQKGVLTYLDNKVKENKVEVIYSLWINNVITCFASKEVIFDLSRRNDIDRIDWDEERKMLINNEILSVDVPEDGKGINEITWNVTKVNVPAVWALGFTGTGIKVGVLDTGVNYNHVDLADHMWNDPGYPNHGYDFVNGDNNPMDDHGHGTHCAGTVAGDGTAGSQTGMAPDATIIALKVLNSSGNGTESGVWAAIQFIVDHGGDVISMSLGWSHSWGPDRPSWRNAYNNALAGGVIAAVAAGNEAGSITNPDDVRTPGDCPPPWLHPDQTLTGGISAVVCVGATDINDAIASFSSLGPVTWSTISPFNDYPFNPGMGLIRPDVSAPGENIKSLDYASNNGYADGWSGTSMATPCVAGVMALMLNKNPNLTPAEIDIALETTALELGTVGKDNVYGSGRINALAAINALGLSANFTANITTVCTGNTVAFTDASGGPPTTWSWSFPGGTPSTASGSGPHAITYSTPGTYNVSLTVGDGIDTDTETKTGYITVQNVFANFSGTPATVVIGNSVIFTDNSSCNPTAWSWSFPGGTPATATGVGPHTITYNTLGNYDVNLTVTKGGSNDTELKTGYITVTPPEFNMANATITTCTGNFYDSQGPSADYNNGENFTMTFYPSTTSAMIRFTFNSFQTESNYDYLYIYNGVNTSAPLIGTYHGSAGPGIVTASNAAGALTFRFTSDGSVVATGWSASISCYSTTVPPVANFSASSTTPAISSTVNFTDLSDGFPTSWVWSFNPTSMHYVGGTNANSQNPQVVFDALGQYSVTLTATNAYGFDIETKLNYINVINCTLCPAGGADGSEEWIANVTFNTINNSSSAGTGYTDYSGICTTVTPGSTYPVSVSCGSVGSWTEHIWVFIDWNQNCSFLDAGESTDLGQITGTGALTGNITAPISAVSGSTRLRAMLKYAGDPTPCELNYSFGETEDYCITIPSQTVYVDVTAFLEGPYNGSVMSQGLTGFVPLNQPYNVAPWNYTGTESVVSIPANAIDWVLIELRDAASAGGAGSATRIGRQAAFLRNDGRVVGLNGNPVLDFGALTVSNGLYAILHHRNHVSVLSSVALSQTSGTYTYNFSTGAGQAYNGTAGHKQIAPGVWGMFGGDGNKDGSVNLLDESPTWEVTAGTKGYLGTDYNLDSQSNNLDKDNVWAPNIGHGTQVPN